MLTLTARVAAGQTEQLYLDTACDIEDIDESDILRVHAANFSPYLNCSISLATVLTRIENDIAQWMLTSAVPIGQGFQVQNDLAGFTELKKQLASGNPDTLTLANTSDLARRRHTTVVRAALDRLTGADRTQLLSYLGGDDSIDIADIIDLIRTSGALAHCDTLVANLFTQARRNIVDAPHLPPEIRNALAAIWKYMFDLYDPDSEVSRLYLQARPSIQASNPPSD